MPESKTSKNLPQRLLAIMQEAGTIEKGGYNAHSRYKYVQEADVAKKFQELLVAHGVFLYSSVEDVVHQKTQTASGKPAMFVGVKMLYTFVNADNPEEKFEVRAAGDGMDTGDKAIYKALTGAHKYLLIRNFNLGSDEDAEKGNADIDGTSRPQAKPQQRGSQAPQNASMDSLF